MHVNIHQHNMDHICQPTNLCQGYQAYTPLQRPTCSLRYGLAQSSEPRLVESTKQPWCDLPPSIYSPSMIKWKCDDDDDDDDDDDLSKVSVIMMDVEWWRQHWPWWWNLTGKWSIVIFGDPFQEGGRSLKMEVNFICSGSRSFNWQLNEVECGDMLDSLKVTAFKLVSSFCLKYVLYPTSTKRLISNHHLAHAIPSAPMFFQCVLADYEAVACKTVSWQPPHLRGRSIE